MKPTARLHKILAKDESSQIGGLRLPSGDFPASDQEVADHLLETHLPGCQPIMENTVRAIPVRTPTEEYWHRTANSDKIRWAIEGFGSFKSGGEDSIFPALLINGIEILSGPLVKIFTACLALGYIPEAWQRVRVIFAHRTQNKKNGRVRKKSFWIFIKITIIFGLENSNSSWVEFFFFF
jgi:hypothetical protein